MMLFGFLLQLFESNSKSRTRYTRAVSQFIFYIVSMAHIHAVSIEENCEYTSTTIARIRTIHMAWQWHVHCIQWYMWEKTRVDFNRSKTVHIWDFLDVIFLFSSRFHSQCLAVPPSFTSPGAMCVCVLSRYSARIFLARVQLTGRASNKAVSSRKPQPICA